MKLSRILLVDDHESEVGNALNQAAVYAAREGLVDDSWQTQ